MTKMNAIVKSSADVKLSIEQVSVPELKPSYALIKVLRTALNSTDLRIFKWTDWSSKNIALPHIIGKEFVGEIVKINGESDSFKTGDLVVGQSNVPCGVCRNCRGGKTHLCAHTKTFGIDYSGVNSEYITMPLNNLWKCDSKIDLNTLAIFDSLGSATHTALTYDVIGEDVLVTGAGPIGIMTAEICSHIGARNIVITDINEYRLNLAKEVCPKATIVDATKVRLNKIQTQLCMNEGFDVGLEMSGSGQALCEMIDNMIGGGKIAMFARQKDGAIVDWNKVVCNSLTVKGIYGRQIFETWHKMTSMLESGLDVSKVVTHTFNYKDFQQGFDVLATHNCGKVVLKWD